MTKTITRSTGCLTGKGRNITEAKADLAEQVDRALSGSYTPRLITVPDSNIVVFVWRDPLGWQYKITDIDQCETRSELLYGCSCDCKRISDHETVRQARAHLAQWIFEWDGRTGAEVINNADDRKDHLRWVEWQYRYKAWLNTGMTDHEAHAKACQCYEPLWPTDHTPPTLSADGNAVQP